MKNQTETSMEKAAAESKAQFEDSERRAEAMLKQLDGLTYAAALSVLERCREKLSHTIVHMERQPVETRKEEAKKEILNRKETAEYLGISIATLDRWVKKEIIPAFHAAGGSVLFNKELVEKVVKGDEAAI